MNKAQMNQRLERQLRRNEEVYRLACAAFGGAPRVFRHYDQSDEVSIDLLTVEDSPRPGLISYSTLGLQHYSAGLRENGKPLRSELTGVCCREYEYYPELLSACAFEIMSSHFPCRAGAVWQDCIQRYVQRSTLRHLLFAPCQNGQMANPIDFEDQTTIWLQAVPISDGELAHQAEYGTESLLQKLTEADAELADFCRISLW